MNNFDVAVIGSGPAGAIAAYLLAKNGVSVVIIEKEILPRYKTCGGGLVHRGKSLLPFDISAAVEREFTSCQMYYGSKKKPLATSRPQSIITMVMRDSFDQLIVQQALDHGAQLLQNHTVTGLEFKDEITIHTTATVIRSKFVIAADGALSPVAKLAGWKETRNIMPALEYEVEVSEAIFERLSKNIRFDIDAVPSGYGWCFPKKKHLSIGVMILTKTKNKIDLKGHYINYLKTIGIEEVLSEVAHGFVIPISPRTDGFMKNNVLLTGDAAGFADPVVAEGLSNALLSGTLAAEALIDAKLDPILTDILYHKKLNQKLLPELNTAAKVSKMFYSNHHIRNLLLNKFGQLFAEAMTDLFMGLRTYPKDYQKAIREKIKRSIFN